MLAAALKRMDIQAVPLVEEPPRAAPAVTDPVVDPSLIKRIPSDKRLATLGAVPAPGPMAPPQPPAAGLQQAGSLPLGGAGLPAYAGVPLGDVGLAAGGLDSFAPYLQQHQQLPPALAAAAAAQGPFVPHPHGLGLQGPDAQLLPPQQLHPLMPAPHTALHAAPLQQPDVHAAAQSAAAAWGAGLAHLQQQQQQQPAAHVAPQGGMSLLDIQREEQEAEARRAAAAAAQQQQQQQYEVPVAAKPQAAAPAPRQAAAMPLPKPAAQSLAPPQPAPVEAERPRPETKAAPWAAPAAGKTGWFVSQPLRRGALFVFS